MRNCASRRRNPTEVEVPQFVSRDDVRAKVIDPFKRAVKVTVDSSRMAEGVELELPRSSGQL
jgi:hypothetical protein